MNLRSLISEELWLFLLFGVVLGLALPQVGVYLTSYAIYFLLVLMFLTILEINLRDIKKALAHKYHLLMAILLIFVVSPLIALGLSFMLEEELALGLILYSAIPSAMANAFYLGRIKGNAALALVITAVTTIMAPLVTPVVVQLLSGFFVELNAFNLFLSLVKFIVLPLIAAELVKEYAKNVTKKLLDWSGLMSNVCLFVVVFGVIAGAAGEVWNMGHLILIMFFYFGICFSLGYISDRKERRTLGFANGFRNGTLMMVVGLEVFGPVVALVGIVAILVHNIVLVLLMFWTEKDALVDALD